jgi:hypothetical protein
MIAKTGRDTKYTMRRSKWLPHQLKRIIDSRLRFSTADDLLYGYMMCLMHFAILRVGGLSISPLRCSGQHGSEAFALAAKETGHGFGRWRETLWRTFL